MSEYRTEEQWNDWLEYFEDQRHFREVEWPALYLEEGGEG